MFTPLLWLTQAILLQENPAEITVHRFAEEGMASVNTYWVETTDQVLVVDVQRTTPAAQKAIARVKAAGKPVTAIFISHAHPDHVGGLNAFHTAFPEAKIYATAKTIAFLREDTYGYLALSREILGDLVPAELHLPGQRVRDGQQMSFGALKVEVKVLGPNEFEELTVLSISAANRTHLFVSDLINHQMTPFLLDADLDNWLAELDLVKQWQADVVHPGHGPGADPETLITYQREYLNWIMDLVRPYEELETLKQDLPKLVQQIKTRYGDVPVAEIPNLSALNLEAVFKYLAAKR